SHFFHPFRLLSEAEGRSSRGVPLPSKRWRVFQNRACVLQALGVLSRLLPPGSLLRFGCGLLPGGLLSGGSKRHRRLLGPENRRPFLAGQLHRDEAKFPPAAVLRIVRSGS